MDFFEAIGDVLLLVVVALGLPVLLVIALFDAALECRRHEREVDHGKW